jgi:hypothetical protein
MPRRSPLPRELFEEYSEKLEALLDERDDVAEKRRSISKALKGEVQILDGRIAHVRRVLKGHEAPQLDFAGMEVGEWKRDSIIERILGWAAKIRDEKTRQEKEREKDEAEEKPAAEEQGEKKEKPKKEPKPQGLAWMKREDGTQFATVEGGAYELKVALDGQWTANWAPTKGERSIVVGGFGLAEREARAACETHHLKRTAPPEKANGAEKKPEPPPLTWKWVRENVQAAIGVEGTYELERLEAGGFTATFRKARAKKTSVIVIGDPEQKAKDACTAHHIERFADAMLANAGDGKLNRADMKGDATARKKGRRASP